MHCISLTPRLNTISAILCLLACFLSRMVLSQVSCSCTFTEQYMAKEYFNQVSFTFEAVQCALSPIFFLRQLARIPGRHYKTSRLFCKKIPFLRLIFTSTFTSTYSPSLVFIINNKNSINIIYQLRYFACEKIFLKIFGPLYSNLAKIARNF